MYIDCHSHTDCSPDGSNSVLEMVSAAQRAGLEVYAVTDHCEIDNYEADLVEQKLPILVKEVTELKKTAKLKLLLGVEMGQATFNEKLADRVLSSAPFDMVIGSVHRVPQLVDFYWLEYDKMSDEEINRALEYYFDELLRLAKRNKFDTLAHISYPYRYIFQRGRFSAVRPKLARCDEMAAEVFKTLIENGKALEDNRGAVTEAEYVDLHYRYFGLYKRLGGRLITVGADAHRAEDVGARIKDGYKRLKALGFNEICWFENRKAVVTAID